MTRSASGLLLVMVLLMALGVGTAGAGLTTRVSVASNGAQGDRASSTTSQGTLNWTGRYVTFNSDARNLVPGDTNNQWDVFLKDRQTGKTRLVSIATGGTQGNANSLGGWLSTDARFIAFTSHASNLVPGDTNGYPDAFVHDRQTGQTTRVSVASDGSQGNHGSEAQGISGDGRFVVFESWASNLVPNDTNQYNDIFVRDCIANTTTRVSVATGGGQGNANSYYSSMNTDGRYVAFSSTSSNLVPGDTNSNLDIFVHDRALGQTVRVSVASDGTQADYPSYHPAISGTGRFVAFDSVDTNLAPGDTGVAPDVFLHDRQTGQTTRVSVGPAGLEGNGRSEWPVLNADGRYIAFVSEASNLVPGDTNSASDVFVHDRRAGLTTRVSVSSTGGQGTGVYSHLGISADGRLVAFSSLSSGLVPGDTNGQSDVFVHDRLAGVLPDMWISARGVWVGDDIYNTTGRGQSQGRVVAVGGTAKYRLKIQNDGSEAGQVLIQGTGGTADWQVQYFDRGSTGGADVTAQVTGAGFQTPTINPGASLIGRVEVTPLSGAASGSKYTVAVSGTPVGSPMPEDVVKANTTVRASPNSPQIATLAAVPTAGGAEVVFSLSAPATVTARVFNIAGRPVKTLCHAMDCVAGSNTLLWNAQGENGLTVPNGTYLVEVTAKTGEGPQTRALAQVHLGR